ncbi:MAG TPA: YlmH/Sll1252 family protein [Lachnospiraceae bacterium]|nr:YlmH/Sll1252 family protein [Lachnospiraceae bacterium]
MAIHSDKEELQIRKRLLDLAEKSFRQNVFCFTDFLGLAEQDIYYRMEKELLFSHPAFFGGDNQAERKMIRFGSPEERGYDEAYPITCIHVLPLLKKFSDDFSHRDFLGAMMNLGMERDCIGDIRIGNREGYLYCISSMAEFVCENLMQIKHTHVRCEIVDQIGETGIEKPVELEVVVGSLRVDACLAKTYNISRTESIALFSDRKVFVNGRLAENNSRNLKTGETVNVRGYGKFLFQGVKYETKKGKFCLSIALYR